MAQILRNIDNVFRVLSKKKQKCSNVNGRDTVPYTIEEDKSRQSSKAKSSEEPHLRNNSQ